jgi:surface protein
MSNKNGNYKNIIRIKYKTDNSRDNKIRLFGNEFVHNNKNNCKIITDSNEEYELYTHWYKHKIKYDIFEIKLKIIRPLINIQGMFSMCNSLLSSSDISNFDTSHVKNMSYLFYECSSLLFLPDISKWDTSNVMDMNNMFSGCQLLLTLPDISKWNTSNVNNFSCMFYKCQSLSIIPDISKWNLNKAYDIGSMFRDCSSLFILPDISKWNINKIASMISMFEGCTSLQYLPNISKLITSVDNSLGISNIFKDCINIIKIKNYI